MKKTATITLALLLSASPAAALSVKLIDSSTPYSAPSASWGSNDYAFAQAAVQGQANAVASFYHKAGLHVYGVTEQAPAGAWPVYIRNQCSLGGKSYAAFHWTSNGRPYACIASIGGGGFWWMTRAMEHETAEMVGDPSATGREIVDPVAQWFGGVNVQDGQFFFDYSATAADYPFVDFLLPRSAWKSIGFEDYLHQLTD